MLYLEPIFWKKLKKSSNFMIIVKGSMLIIPKFVLTNVCISCAENWAFLSEGPFCHESVFIHSYILVHQILKEITSIWCFLAIKCQLSNTLKHICFEKMPRNWEFAHEIHSLRLIDHIAKHQIKRRSLIKIWKSKMSMKIRNVPTYYQRVLKLTPTIPKSGFKVG